MKIRKIIKNQAGATAIEYGLIAALIAVVLITVLGLLGGNVNNTFRKVSNAIATSNSR
jgi:pilus assembly protein Flp/PilA